jgi:hypothetical protein
VTLNDADAIRLGNVIGSSTIRVVSWRDGAAHDAIATAIAAHATCPCARIVNILRVPASRTSADCHAPVVHATVAA